MHTSHTITVSSWNELLEIIYKDSWNPQIGRHQSPYVFRALEDRNYRLSASLNRLGSIEAEQNLLDSYRHYSDKKPTKDGYWNWLMQAADDGLPTRLMAWSSSPFVALHFAVANPAKFHLDAVLWAVNYRDAKLYWPDPLALSKTAASGGLLQVSSLEELAADANSLAGLKRKDYALFVEPAEGTVQNNNQALVYSMLSNAQRLMDDWLQGKKIGYLRVVIPAALKQEIRDKLDMANVQERLLFPGQQGLMDWLKRQYYKAPKRLNNQNGTKETVPTITPQS